MPQDMTLADSAEDSAPKGGLFGWLNSGRTVTDGLPMTPDAAAEDAGDPVAAEVVPDDDGGLSIATFDFQNGVSLTTSGQGILLAGAALLVALMVFRK